MEEIIQKHTDSGHYDDPDYDFSTWLDKVLPNIRPGFVYDWGNGNIGLHFFKKYQIWPKVRHWMAEEIAEMPKSLWPYLAISEHPLSVAGTQDHAVGGHVLLPDGSIGSVTTKSAHSFTGTVTHGTSCATGTCP